MNPVGALSELIDGEPDQPAIDDEHEQRDANETPGQPTVIEGEPLERPVEALEEGSDRPGEDVLFRRCRLVRLEQKRAQRRAQVSETSSEIAVAVAIVTANWRKNWPVIPVMNAAGMNTAEHERNGDERSRPPPPWSCRRRRAGSFPRECCARHSRPRRWRHRPRCRWRARDRTARGC